MLFIESMDFLKYILGDSNNIKKMKKASKVSV